MNIKDEEKKVIKKGNELLTKLEFAIDKIEDVKVKKEISELILELLEMSAEYVEKLRKAEE